MSRVWVHQRMKNHAPLTALVSTRIAAATAQEKAPDTKPFIVHRAISELPDLRGDDTVRTRTDTYLIFVHDVPGDYMQIDQILSILRQLFENVSDQEENIIRSTWIENSEDFRDDDMGTILKYARIQVKSRVV